MTTNNEYNKLVLPNVVDRRCQLYANEPSDTVTPLVALSGTVQGWKKDRRNKLPVIKSPYQGLNYLLGDHGGFRRGELVTISAIDQIDAVRLSMDLLIGTMRYDTPCPIDPAMRSMVTFVNTHNEYRDLLESRFNEVATWDDPDDSTAEPCPFEYNILNPVNDAQYSIYDIFRYIERVYADNYEIQLMVIDDITNLAFVDSDNKFMTSADKLYHLRKYCEPLGITLIVPLSFDRVIASYREDAPDDYLYLIAQTARVPKFRHVEQQADCSLLLDVNNQDVKLYCSKHRGFNTRHEYAIYSNMPAGSTSMVFDINGTDNSVIIEADRPVVVKLSAPALDLLETNQIKVARLLLTLEDTVSRKMIDRYLNMSAEEIIVLINRHNGRIFLIGVDGRMTILSLVNDNMVTLTVSADELHLRSGWTILELLMYCQKLPFDKLVVFAESMVFALSALESIVNAADTGKSAPPNSD